MADRLPNPYGYQTPIGQGLASLVQAYMAAPTAEQRAQQQMQTDALQSDIAYKGVAARKTQADMDAAAAQTTNRNNFLANLKNTDLSQPGAIAALMQGALTAGYNPNDIGSLRIQLDQSDPSIMANGGSYASTRDAFGRTQALDLTKANMSDATSRRGQDITAGTSRYNTDRTVGENARQFDLGPDFQKGIAAAGVNQGTATLPQQAMVGGAPSMDQTKASLVGQNFPSMTPNQQQMVMDVNPTVDTEKGRLLQNAQDAGAFAGNEPIGANTPEGAVLGVKDGTADSSRFVTTPDQSKPSGYSYQPVQPGMEAPAPRSDQQRYIPANINTAMTENMNSVKKINQALAGIGFDASGQSNGSGQPGAVGPMNMITPEFARQWLDPNGTTARALIADIGSLKIHDRSGAAVTAAETPRLIPFIPQVTDRPEIVAQKLINFRNEYMNVLNDMDQVYSEEGGYRPNTALKQFLQSGGTAAQDAVGQAQGGSDPLADARSAIARGADRAAVIQRLQQNGIDPSGL